MPSVSVLFYIRPGYFPPQAPVVSSTPKRAQSRQAACLVRPPRPGREFHTEPGCSIQLVGDPERHTWSGGVTEEAAGSKLQAKTGRRRGCFTDDGVRRMAGRQDGRMAEVALVGPRLRGLPPLGFCAFLDRPTMGIRHMSSVL